MIAGKKVGFALTGSFCTIASVLPYLQELVAEGADVTPIMSESMFNLDTRFGKAEDFKLKVQMITGKEIISTIPEAEPIGPKSLLDILVVVPCTGNTVAKLAYGITDTPVTMACKAHLRNQKPLVLAISTNDGLSGNAKNIGLLLNTKNIFFVPFGQDDPVKKCNSLAAKLNLLKPTIEEAFLGRQLQPVLV